MRLETAMISGREGITAHGQAISVVGDNIANVNTTAYKSSRAEFSDLYSAGTSGSEVQTIPTTGSGSQVRDVRSIFTNGSIDSTGRELDVGIDGNGFFLVGSAEEPVYTRAGNFSLNADGELVTSDGLQVLGFAPGATTLSPINVTSVNITGSATTEAGVTGNLDATLANTTPPENPGSFTDLGSSGAFTSSMRVFDSLGAGHDVNLYYFKTAANQWTVQGYVDAEEVGGAAGTPALVGETVLNFGENGTIAEADRAGSAIQAANVAWSNGAAAGNFSIGLGAFTQYASASSISGNTQNGQSVGSVIGYSVGADGAIEAVLSSGSRQTVGVIALTDFTNRDGLDRAGSQIYKDAGEAGPQDPGAPGSSSLGLLKAGALELSNVDLSSEFVQLVVYQRGYQASSQTIQAVNELLQATIALIR